MRRFHPAAAGAPRVVIFPHAGGSASYYHGLSRVLSPDVDPVIVQYPGRAERIAEDPIEDIPTMIERIPEQLDTLAPEPRTGYFGHSMGATIAFGVARSRPPAQLFLSARRPPVHHRPEDLGDRSDEAILAHVRQLAGTSAAVFDNPELLEMVMPAMRADYRALQRFTPDTEQRVDVPIIAMVGDNDPRVSPEEAADWARNTTRNFTERVFTGGHFYVDDHLAEVADIIRRSLSG